MILTTGPRVETPESVALALATWADIFREKDSKVMLKTLRVNTAEAVELECEARNIPRAIKKARFPFLRPRYLGEICFSDTVEYKVGGNFGFVQVFYTQGSRYCMVYNVDNQKAINIVAAFEKWFRDV